MTAIETELRLNFKTKQKTLNSKFASENRIDNKLTRWSSTSRERKPSFLPRHHRRLVIIKSKISRTFTSHRPEPLSSTWWTEGPNPTRRPTLWTIKIPMERGGGGAETAGTSTVVVHRRIGETRRPWRTIIVVRVIIVVVVAVAVSSVPIQFG